MPFRREKGAVFLGITRPCKKIRTNVQKVLNARSKIIERPFKTIQFTDIGFQAFTETLSLQGFNSFAKLRKIVGFSKFRSRKKMTYILVVKSNLL